MSPSPSSHPPTPSALPQGHPRKALHCGERGRREASLLTSVPGRYGSVPFTKNPEKYIKYHVEQVGDMIDRLFDTSA